MGVINKFHSEPLGKDAVRESEFSFLEGLTNVAAKVMSDDNGWARLHIVNVSSVAINPDSVSTYDDAPTGSKFEDPIGAAIYYKTGATTWSTVNS